jgi:outer membrane lipoprotein-sorting protein
MGRPTDRFTEIYNHSLIKQRAIHSIRASFTETTVSTLLVKPLVEHGTVVAANPGRVRMTYTDPERKILTMDGRTLTIVWPDGRGREHIDISDIQKRVDQYFTNASIDQLRAMFEIVAEPDLTMKHTDRVDMRPKRKPIQAGLDRLALWVDRDTDLLVQIRLSFPGGDEKTISLQDFALNVPVTDDLFRGRV